MAAHWVLRILLALVAHQGLDSPRPTGSPESAALQSPPVSAKRYELDLSLPEFSVLHSAAAAGVGKYGGDAEFRVRIANTPNGPSWRVTIDDPRLIEVWQHWMSERSTSILTSLDLTVLSEGDRTVLLTVQAVSKKLANAAREPVFEPVPIEGTVQSTVEGFVLSTQYGDLRVNRSGRDCSDLVGRHVIGEGIIEAPGSVAILRLREVRPSTLDLFIMSHCPFGINALQAVIGHMRALPAEDAFTLAVHYIFYQRMDSSGPLEHYALHGEPEVLENLVQMILRDQFPSAHLDYLVQRIEEPNLRWEQIAQQIGLAEVDIKNIELLVRDARSSLIQKEFATVSGDFGVEDGSPTFFWEGRRVAKLEDIAALRSIQSSGASGGAGRLESCSKTSR